MKVCDHCGKKDSLEILKTSNKSFELCKECTLRIIDWIKRPHQPSMIEKMFGRN